MRQSGGEVGMAKNVNEEYKRRESISDRLADKIATYVGSWGFIGFFFLLIFLYILLNFGWFGVKPFDCYPYVFLNLILAVMASIQAPIIMMSQNREAKRDRLRSEQDYQVNVRAEQEIQDVQEHLHRMEDRIDELLKEVKRLQRK